MSPGPSPTSYSIDGNLSARPTDVVLAAFLGRLDDSTRVVVLGAPFSFWAGEEEMALKRMTLLLAAACAASAVAGAESTYRLVDHPSNPATSIQRSEAARMLLKKVAAWPDARAVAAIDQERTSEVRKAFSRDVHLRDADAIVNYWRTAVFSGRDVPPPIGREVR